MTTRSRTITRTKKNGPVKGSGAVRREPSTSKAYRFTKVNLRIHEIDCVKTTKEIDRDEIKLAAIKVEGELKNSGGKRKLAAKAEKGIVLDAGKFKKGDTRRYNPPRTVVTYAAGDQDLDWPRCYYATLLMIEEDEGTIGAIVNSAVKAVEDQVAKEVSKAAATVATSVLAGSALGSAIPIPGVGTAIGAAAGAAVGAASKAIKKSRQDDVFDPKSIHMELDRFPSAGGEIQGSKKKVSFKDFQGHYVVTYSWSVS